MKKRIQYVLRQKNFGEGMSQDTSSITKFRIALSFLKLRGKKQKKPYRRVTKFDLQRKEKAISVSWKKLYVGKLSSVLQIRDHIKASGWVEGESGKMSNKK